MAPGKDRGRSSIDYESGLELRGLSTNPLTPQPWWTRPLEDWVARQLCHYMHLEETEDRIGWVLRGTLCGEGPDREPLICDWEPVAILSEELLDEAKDLCRQRFDAGRDSSG